MTTVYILNVGLEHGPSQIMHINVLLTELYFVPYGHVVIHLLLYSNKFAEHATTHLFPYK